MIYYYTRSQQSYIGTHDHWCSRADDRSTQRIVKMYIISHLKEALMY